MDFDGAICPVDVTEQLLEAFADAAWRDLEDDLRGGRRGLRDTLERQAALLTVSREEMLDFALASFALQPSFAPFVAWAMSRDLRLAVASDGLGFYIEPMLRAAGVPAKIVSVHTNDWLPDGSGFGFPNAHARCVGCGTCKMGVVLRHRERFGSVAFVGEGHSDRFGAQYADLTFAKDALAEICARDGLAFIPWTTFDDVRGGLQQPSAASGPVSPEVCPGWTEP
jgi:2-hydroxy-3-keto-5-methylthiopentenyl-1-phosphate phosphatase